MNKFIITIFIFLNIISYVWANPNIKARTGILVDYNGLLELQPIKASLRGRV